MEASRAATTAAAQRILGTTEAAATARASAEGHRVRVVERNGVLLEVHKDLDTGRVDLHVADGLVVRVTAGRAASARRCARAQAADRLRQQERGQSAAPRADRPEGVDDGGHVGAQP